MNKRNLSLLLPVIAAVAGFLLNLAPVDLGFGTHLIFGQAVALFMARFCNKRLAIATISASGVATYFLWHHPWALIVFAIEGAVLTGLRKRYPMAAIDCFFWIVIGVPILYLTYHLILGISDYSLYVVLLKQAFNGLLNVVISELFYTLYILYNVRLGVHQNRVDSKSLAISLILSLTVIPSAAYLSLVAPQIANDYLRIQQQNLKNNASIVNHRVTGWFDSKTHFLTVLSSQILTVRGFEATESMLSYALENFSEIYLVKPGGVVMDLLKSTPRNGCLNDLKMLRRDAAATVVSKNNEVIEYDYQIFYDGCLIIRLPLGFSGAVLYAVPSADAIQTILRADIPADGVEYFIVSDTKDLISRRSGGLSDIYGISVNAFLDELRDGIVSVFTRSGGQLPAMSIFRDSISAVSIPLEHLVGWKLLAVHSIRGVVDKSREQLFSLLSLIVGIALLITMIAVFSVEFIERGFRVLADVYKVVDAEKVQRHRFYYPFKQEFSDILNQINITRRTLVREQRESRIYFEKLSLIFKFAPILMYDLSYVNGRYVKRFIYSEAAAGLLAVTRDQFISDDWWEKNLHLDDAVAAVKFLDKPNLGVTAGEYRLRGADGEYKWFYDVQVLTSQEEGMGYLLDISPVKDSQRQLWQAAKLSSLGEVATGLAHELNQPLNVIKLAASNLIEARRVGLLTDEELFKRLGRIVMQADRAAALISHLRVFGRKPAEKPTKFSVDEAVRGSLSLIGMKIKDDGITLKVGDLTKLPFIKGHMILYEQVVLNLLSNARDSILSKRVSCGDSRVGSDSINILGTENESGVVLTVTDSGAGISDKIIKRLFQPFATTKDVGQGTGLGLYIAYGIIADMGGTISASNVPGGAEFSVAVPRAD